jgi:hypothetical protein
VNLDRGHFGGHQPRLGDTVSIRIPAKFIPFTPFMSEYLEVMVTSLDPLEGKKIAKVTNIHDWGGDLISSTRVPIVEDSTK